MNKNKDLYCLIGDPVSHSLSPIMQNAAFSVLNIDAVYTTMTVRKNEISVSLRTLRELDVKGFNVTMPHKKVIIEYLDEIDELANEIGAVNTVITKGGKLIGKNTDSAGAINAIKDRIGSVKGRTAIVLGRGGAARAISFGLRREGADTVMLTRDEMKESNLSRLIKNVDLVCNCTPIGMDGKSTPVPDEFLRRNMTVFDSVYNFVETPIITAARKRGCAVISGEEMLVSQGIASLELWTGKRVDKRVMQEAITRAKRERIKNQHSNLYLIGFMGTGKSIVGRILADRMEKKFLDTDIEIIKKQRGPISGIFERLGEEVFRDMEKAEIEKSSKEKGVVVSCGGGAVLDFVNVSRMRDSGTVILLNAKPKSILSRLVKGESRPLLSATTRGARYEEIKQLLQFRLPFYTLARDLVVQTDKKKVDQIVREIIGSLGDVT